MESKYTMEELEKLVHQASQAAIGVENYLRNLKKQMAESAKVH